MQNEKELIRLASAGVGGLFCICVESIVLKPTGDYTEPNFPYVFEIRYHERSWPLRDVSCGWLGDCRPLRFLFTNQEQRNLYQKDEEKLP